MKAEKSKLYFNKVAYEAINNGFNMNRIAPVKVFPKSYIYII